MLDNKLNMLDQGVSGFSGRNITDGALGAFLKEVEAGRVVRGSYLLVEDIDRLSRLPVMQAYDVFRRIIGLGIVIVTLNDGQKYSWERLQHDFTPMMPVWFAMARGHGESERKSVLLGKAWRAKKAEARDSRKPIGNTAPGWITYFKGDKDNPPEYRLDPERTALVRRIFQLSIDGYGMGSIAKILNDEGTTTFKGVAWGNSSLDKILNNRAVLGEYQPRTLQGKKRIPTGDPIPDYFPIAIDEATFYRAKKALERRRIFRSTKTAGNVSLWQGIAKCRLCGSPMHLTIKGKLPKGHAYLRCYAAKKKTCEGGYVRLDDSETIFREVLVKLNSVSLVQESSAEVSRQIAETEARIAEHKLHLQQLADALQTVTSPTLIAEVVRREAAVTDLKKRKDDLGLTLASETITDKEAFFDALDLESKEGRSRANALLKDLHVTVEILPARKIEPSRMHCYYVMQHGHPLFDVHHRRNYLSIIPHTEEQLKLVVMQDANRLHSIITYNQNRKKVSGGGNAG